MINFLWGYNMKSRILVVEDNEDMLLNIKLLLELNDFQVLEARNGIEALEVMKNVDQTPDLIVCDIEMPLMNGFELFEQIINNRNWIYIPFVFLTARTTDEEILYGKELGVDDYLTKPYDDKELLSVVKGKIKRSKKTFLKINQLVNSSSSMTQSIDTLERKYWKLIEKSPLGFILLDSNGDLLLMNDAFTSILGLNDREKIKTKQFPNFFSFLSLSEFDQTLLYAGEIVESKISFDIDNLIEKKHITSIFRGKIDIDIIIIPLFNELGNPTLRYIIHENQNIDSILKSTIKTLNYLIKEKDEDLSVEKKKINKIMESIPDGLLVITSDGSIHLVNRVCKDLYLEFSKSEMPESIDQFPEIHNEFVQAIKNLFKKGEEEELLIKPLDERYIHLSSKILNIPSEDTNFIIFLVRDVTPFIELDLLRKQFISNISHELRTPVTAISLSLQNLESFSQKMSKEQQKELIDVTLTSSSILNQLVEDLLLSSKLDTGQLVLLYEVIEISEVVNDVVKSLQSKAENKSIKFEIENNYKGKLRVDRKRFNQILRILIDNAIKYSEEGKKIKIVISYSKDKQNGGVRFDIIDQGRGIPNGDIQKVFDRFFRSTAVNDTGGVGIGLSIAQELVKLHNGTLTVSSELGKGSVFTLIIPSNIG